MGSSFVADILLPIVVFILMLIVGTGMQSGDLGQARAKLRTIAICLGTQLILIPVAAITLVIAIEPAAFMALGIVILSICPSGALSNLYVYFGRGNVALSVVLTATGTLVYVVAFPVLAGTVASLHDVGPLEMSLPIGKMFAQLVGFLLFPVVIGISVRRFVPAAVDANRRLLDLVAGVLLVVTVAISAWVGWSALATSLGEIAMLAALFTITALAVGRVTAQFVPREERSACVIECAVRNIPIAVLMVKDSFDGDAVIGLFVGYFLVHAPILLAYSAVHRRVELLRRAE